MNLQNIGRAILQGVCASTLHPSPSSRKGLNKIGIYRNLLLPCHISPKFKVRKTSANIHFVERLLPLFLSVPWRRNWLKIDRRLFLMDPHYSAMYHQNWMKKIAKLLLSNFLLDKEGVIFSILLSIRSMQFYSSSVSYTHLTLPTIYSV